MRRSSDLKKIVLTVFLSALLALLIGEATLRLFGPVEYFRDRYYRQCDIFQVIPGATFHHPRLGYFHNPNFDLRHTTNEFSVRARSNSRGFRDDEESYENAKVLFLGDSYCFGWGVEDDETCDRYFERRTGLPALNMGVSGYGNVQQRELLRIYGEGRDLRDRAADFLVFRNDLKDNSRLSGPLFPRVRRVKKGTLFTPAGTEEDYLEDARSMEPRWYFPLLRKTCVADLLTVPFHPRMLSNDSPLQVTDEEEFPGFWVNKSESFELVFRKIRSYCEKRSLRLFVAYIPICPEIEAGEAGEPYPRRDPVRRILRSLDVHWGDLTDVLDVEDYYYLDGHLKPSGQEKMANAIADWMADLGWIKEPAPVVPSDPDEEG